MMSLTIYDLYRDFSRECHDGCKYAKRMGWLDDFDWLKEIISNEFYDDPEYVNLTDEEFDKKMEEKVEFLGWERVILLKVGV